MVKTSFAFGDTHHVTIDQQYQSDASDMAKDQLTAYLADKGHTEISIQPIDATIEDCFMELSPPQ